MNELIRINKDLITELDTKDLGNILKPLKKEILLSDYRIDDINDRCSDIVFAKLDEGEELQLKTDHMVYRDTSVGVYFEDTRIGELNEGEEMIPFNLLSAGKELRAIVKRAHISMGKKVLSLTVSMLDY